MLDGGAVVVSPKLGTLVEGWEVKGKPYMTFLRGQVLLNQGTLEQNPGYGIFLECEEPRSPLGGPVV